MTPLLTISLVTDERLSCNLTIVATREPRYCPPGPGRTVTLAKEVRLSSRLIYSFLSMKREELGSHPRSRAKSKTPHPTLVRQISSLKYLLQTSASPLTVTPLGRDKSVTVNRGSLLKNTSFGTCIQCHSNRIVTVSGVICILDSQCLMCVFIYVE